MVVGNVDEINLSNSIKGRVPLCLKECPSISTLLVFEWFQTIQQEKFGDSVNYDESDEDDK